MLAGWGRRAGNEFKAVPPGVFGEEATRAGKRVIVCDFDAAEEQHLAQLFEIVGDERRVGFLCGAEVALDADVQLLGSAH